ncbi:hypothetical protein DCC81_03455 [Chitinophaga parva]|uniref:Thioredoxin domain-containing protein n=1 Tax=Chitinophaga parva TaxID=2169414 RepID=A0A2T7BLP0_9BACT|nr:thioredoxin-like domain-containing protein [Chitinophaga parva]PUZ28550.1 hypothetical protein DCC81_03455 [Chitinophaga parva]
MKRSNLKQHFIAAMLVTGLLLSSIVIGKQKQDIELPPARFHGRIVNYQDGDSLRVLLQRNSLTPTVGSYELAGWLNFYTKVKNDGTFEFELPISPEPSRLHIDVVRRGLDGKQKYLQDGAVEYIIESGDDIKMEIEVDEKDREFSISFSGRGAPKYTCTYLTSHKFFQWDPVVGNFITDAELNKAGEGMLSPIVKGAYDKRYFGAMHILDSMKALISPLVYDVIRADAYGQVYSSMLATYDVFFERAFFFEPGESNVSEDIKALLPHFLDTLNLPPLPALTGKTADNFALSTFFKNFLIGQQIYRLRAQGKEKFDCLELENQLLNIPMTSFLRDKVLAMFLLTPTFTLYTSLNQRSMDECWDEGIKQIKTPYIRSYVQANNVVHRGRAAYNFELSDPSDKKVRLSDFKGKVVLMDTWFTGCGGCIRFHKRFEQEIYPSFRKDTNFIVVSICSDKDKNSWIKSMQSDKYTNAAYVNLYTNGLGDDAPVLLHYKANMAPFILIIGKDGKIHSRIYDNSSSDIIRDIKDALSKS